MDKTYAISVILLFIIAGLSLQCEYYNSFAFCSLALIVNALNNMADNIKNKK